MRTASSHTFFTFTSYILHFTNDSYRTNTTAYSYRMPIHVSLIYDIFVVTTESSSIFIPLESSWHWEMNAARLTDILDAITG